MKTTSISITKEQYEWLQNQTRNFNLSYFVRQKLNELIEGDER